MSAAVAAVVTHTSRRINDRGRRRRRRNICPRGGVYKSNVCYLRRRSARYCLFIRNEHRLRRLP